MSGSTFYACAIPGRPWSTPAAAYANDRRTTKELQTTNKRLCCMIRMVVKVRLNSANCLSGKIKLFHAAAAAGVFKRSTR
jgi:hypothetical protein